MRPTENISDARTAPKSGAYEDGMLRYLTVAGLAFLALVMALEPDVGFVAPPVARLVFWAIQICTGLLVLQSVLYLLTRMLGASRVPSWALVLLSGIVGAVVLAPLYWLIGEGMMERWLGYPLSPDEKGVGLDDFTVGHALLGEYLDIVGPVTTGWALICLPRLHWLVPPLLHAPVQAAAVTQSVVAGSAPGEARSGPAALDADSPEIPGDPAWALPAGARPAAEDPQPDVTEATASRARLHSDWCERLPSEMGHDVIAVASELQYLRVWTPRGCALILGSLSDVEAAAGAEGLRVHRSWWVACRHVIGVRRTASGAVCLMSDGRQVPVSRRRRADVFARFGDAARYFPPDSSEAVAKTDLN